MFNPEGSGGFSVACTVKHLNCRHLGLSLQGIRENVGVRVIVFELFQFLVCVSYFHLQLL
jgi:hypothetical protein